MDGKEFLRRMDQGPAEQEKVFRESYAWMRRICLGVCSRFRVVGGEAEDLAQEALIKVLKKWATYDGTAELSTWVYQIARNQVLDELRRRKTRVGDLTDSGEGVVREGEPAPVSSLEQRLCVEQVLAELETHPPARKGAMRLFDLLVYIVENGPSTAELATFIGTTEVAAKERKSYLVRRLKEICLRHCGHERCVIGRAEFVR